MNSYDIEVSIDVKMQAGIAFWIDKATWNGMTQEAQTLEIIEHIDELNAELNDDVIRFRSANISAVIMSPDGIDEPVDFTTVQIYDPKD